MKRTLHRTAFLFLLFTSSFLTCKAQWVSIPDVNFINWLNTNGYAPCMNGTLMDTSCPAVVGAISIYCASQSISDLTGMQYFDNLDTLDCYGNPLTSLPALPSGLTYLECNSNYLTSLPALPAGLTYLDCYNNQLTNLPALPAGLTYLGCSSNQLTNLPALPAGLTELSCYNNQLTNLPALPAGLKILYCDNNQLTNLPALPSGLIGLYCRYNQLTNLPVLPVGLTELVCQENQLTTLPEFPDSLNNCFIGINPIICLPQLKRIVYFDFSNTSVTCLPNYGNVTGSNPTLSSLPLCDSANANGCSYCHAYFSVQTDSSNTGIYNGFNESYGSNITSYLWEFGDGDTSTLPYPSHNYAQPGQYYVCLTVSSPDCTNTFCDSSFYVFKTEGGLMSELHILDPTPVKVMAAVNDFKIFVHPNPATTHLFVQTSGITVTEINIYNTTGSLVSQTKQLLNNYLDISQLATGVYIAEIKSRETSVRRRWVKI